MQFLEGAYISLQVAAVARKSGSGLTGDRWQWREVHRRLHPKDLDLNGKRGRAMGTSSFVGIW
jgi:hypothetical protein